MFRLKVLVLIVLFPVLWPIASLIDALPDMAKEFKHLVILFIDGE